MPPSRVPVPGMPRSIRSYDSRRVHGIHPRKGFPRSWGWRSKSPLTPPSLPEGDTPPGRRSFAGEPPPSSQSSCAPLPDAAVPAVPRPPPPPPPLSRSSRAMSLRLLQIVLGWRAVHRGATFGCLHSTARPNAATVRVDTMAPPASVRPMALSLIPDGSPSAPLEERRGGRPPPAVFTLAVVAVAGASSLLSVLTSGSGFEAISPSWPSSSSRLLGKYASSRNK